jgi:hypothetical protein
MREACDVCLSGLGFSCSTGSGKNVHWLLVGEPARQQLLPPCSEWGFIYLIFFYKQF